MEAQRRTQKHIIHVFSAFGAILQRWKHTKTVFLLKVLKHGQNIQKQFVIHIYMCLFVFLICLNSEARQRGSKATARLDNEALLLKVFKNVPNTQNHTTMCVFSFQRALVASKTRKNKCVCSEVLKPTKKRTYFL